MGGNKRILSKVAVVVALLAVLGFVLPASEAEAADTSTTLSTADEKDQCGNRSCPSGEPIPIQPEKSCAEFVSVDVPPEQIWNYDSDNSSTILRPAISDVVSDENLTEASLLWWQSTHMNIAEQVLSTSSTIDCAWWNTLITACDDPDDWWFDFLYGYHYADHGACGKVKQYADSASNYFKNGDLGTGYQRLGWSSHYLMDLGNPYHTFWSLAELLVHGWFEEWISDHWTDPQYMLVNEVKNRGANNYLQLGGDLEDLGWRLVDLVWYWEPVFTLYLTTGAGHDEFVTGVKYCLRCTAEFLDTLYEYVGLKTLRVQEIHDQYWWAEVHGVGDNLLKGAAFKEGRINFHVEVYTAETTGDTSTDYLYLYAYRSSGWSRWIFTDLPQANGGTLTYENQVFCSKYQKIERIELVWHQWTWGQSSGNMWHMRVSDYDTTVTADIEGYGFHQTFSTYYEARGSTFGDDSKRLSVRPCTSVKLHLEVWIEETYGDTSTGYLYIWVYYTDGTSGQFNFYNLPEANGGTVTYDATLNPDTHKIVDHFEFLWHQWTWGQSSGHSWSIRAQTTIYWDTEPTYWPY